ncbi:MAG: hypothetical protein R3C45_18240 [Phycisphaerales bacterium]
MGAADTDWFQLNLLGNTNYTFTVLGAGMSGATVRLYSSGLTLLGSDNGPVSGATLAELDYAVLIGDVYVEVVGNGGATGNYLFAVQETERPRQHVRRGHRRGQAVRGSDRSRSAVTSTSSACRCSTG